MLPLFEVIKPGLLTTVQDLGRFGHRHLGVPVSGGVDRWALSAANILTGNDLSAACLEITLSGPTVAVLRDCLISITGADMDPRLSGEPVPMWECLYCRQGQVLSFGYRRTGCRTYLSVGGGIIVPQVLGSSSTFLTAGFGGHCGRKLEAGDILYAGTPALNRERLGLRYPNRVRPVYAPSFLTRAVKGINSDRFAEKEYARFFRESFTFSDRLNRMGCSLIGPVLVADEPAIAESYPVAPGSIQVLPSGNPVILLNDAQSTGGYPQIAAVINADLWQIAQAVPGDRVMFQETDTKTALTLLKLRKKELYCLERANRVKFFQTTAKNEYEIIFVKKKIE